MAPLCRPCVCSHVPILSRALCLACYLSQVMVYLEDHKIGQLLENLTASIVYAQPGACAPSCLFVIAHTLREFVPHVVLDCCAWACQHPHPHVATPRMVLPLRYQPLTARATSRCIENARPCRGPTGLLDRGGREAKGSARQQDNSPSPSVLATTTWTAGALEEGKEGGEGGGLV